MSGLFFKESQNIRTKNIFNPSSFTINFVNRSDQQQTYLRRKLIVMKQI